MGGARQWGLASELAGHRASGSLGAVGGLAGRRGNDVMSQTCSLWRDSCSPHSSPTAAPHGCPARPAQPPTGRPPVDGLSRQHQIIAVLQAPLL